MPKPGTRSAVYRRLLAAHPEYSSEKIHGTPRSVIHIDVAPMDNSGSHKESVSCTYKKFDGYAPIFAYMGPHGFYGRNERGQHSTGNFKRGAKSPLLAAGNPARAIKNHLNGLSG